MSSLFGGRSVSVPTAPAPRATYTELSPEVRRRAEDFRRRLLKGLGREGTILTGLGGYKGFVFPGVEHLGGGSSKLGSLSGGGPTSTVGSGGERGAILSRLLTGRYHGQGRLASVLG